MPADIDRILVANRGEIAIRIIRAAGEMDIGTVAIYSEDDDAALHLKKADQAIPLGAKGAAAYLNAANIVRIAKEQACDAIHPGYGFLSENGDFARLCATEGINFIGPSADCLRLFGDKAAARKLAQDCEVPTLAGTTKATSLAEAEAFLNALGDQGAMVIKAIAGGGGRGIRVVENVDQIADAYAICQSEAQQAFGNGDVYVEELIARARHIEVQIIADNAGTVSHLGERECSLQRRHQKVVEIAPSPTLSDRLRQELCAAAVKMAKAADYQNIGTFEFLVDATDDSRYAFIEANARLQVEHTVTEAVTGVDIVQTQIAIAGGDSLADLGLARPIEPHGYAMQLRVNMETMLPDGRTRPAGGVLTSFDVPTGPGIRVDSFGYAGYRTSPSFDSLLAKVISHSPAMDFGVALKRGYRALCEFKIEGVATNISFLQNLLRHPNFSSGNVYTRFVDDHIAVLAANETGDHQKLYFEPANAVKRAGAKVDDVDPLAVLSHGRRGEAAVLPEATASMPDVAAPAGTTPVIAPMQGTIVSISVTKGDPIHLRKSLMVMESMKMQHVIEADVSGILHQLAVAEGDTVFEGSPLVFIEEADIEAPEGRGSAEVNLDHIRADLQEVIDRHAFTLDENRPDAQAKRAKTGQRMARHNVDELCDPGSFSEYGALVIASQRTRRSVDDLIRRTPADGLIAGFGRVNGDLFDDEKSRCAVMSYDYTVLAGTQGKKNHDKKDRMFELAAKWRLPMVFFTEGGGGRPGDVDYLGVAGLTTPAFHLFGRLSGLVPLVGVNSGRCFAGNAALLGSCDVVIATENSTIGMGGPAMIEGGNLGVFHPEEVGPMDIQVPNGVVDIAVKDEAEAVRVVKKYLSYFQGPLDDWDCADQRLLRNIIPENRLRIYDVRDVIDTMADTDSVLEIRKHFGLGMVTSFIRIEGRPMGVIANNPSHLAGAIDSDGADKAARFMQLCDAFDIPIVMLCDTPGMMVGPEVEKTALVRHCSRLFVTGANVTVPLFTIVLRKGYGLGAQAMAGGSFHAAISTVGWPTGEFGGMGLEGAVKLGFRKELEALDDPAERKALFDEMVAEAYARGKAINTASFFELDGVIDPMETRLWLSNGLRAMPPTEPRTGKKHAFVDTW